jgi:hypothetical protein
MDNPNTISLSQLSVYDIFSVIGPGGFFVLLLVLISSLSASIDLETTLYLESVPHIVVWILVFGLLVHISKIGDIMFFRRTLRLRYQGEIQRLIHRLGWPSILPLVERISANVKGSLDRLESLRLFCANTLFTCSSFFIVIWGMIAYELLVEGHAGNIGSMIALAALLVAVGVLLHRQGSNYQHLEATTLQYYLKKEIPPKDETSDSSD